MSNYGLNDSMQYLELELDSSEALVSSDGTAVVNPLSATNAIRDNPQFVISGRKPLKNIAAIKVLEVQIPFTWYIIEYQKNDTFTIKYNLTLVDVTIPAGNYTPAQLVPVLNSICDNVQTGLPFDILWLFDDVSGKFKSGRSGGGMGSNYTFIVNNQSLADILGLQYGAQVWVNIASVPYYVSNSYVAQLSGPNYLYVNSNTLGSLVNLYLPRISAVGGNSGPQIAKIPVNVSPGGVIYWQDPDPQKWFEADNLQSLDNLDLFLSLGLSRDILRLNGASFSIKLGILLWKENQVTYSGGDFKAYKGPLPGSKVGQNFFSG